MKRSRGAVVKYKFLFRITDDGDGYAAAANVEAKGRFASLRKRTMPRRRRAAVTSMLACGGVACRVCFTVAFAGLVATSGVHAATSQSFASRTDTNRHAESAGSRLDKNGLLLEQACTFRRVLHLLERNVRCGCSGQRSLHEELLPKKRVALAFFGLTRSLKYTIDSIRNNIFQKLEQANIEYDVYLHTYNLSSLTNERSGEASVALNTSEWRLLQPDYYVTTDQAAFLQEYAPSIEACKTTGDYYKDDFQSVTNLMCQLNSIRQVTDLWRATHRQYDVVMYLRPDVLYNCPLPVDVIRTMQPDTLHMADFHHWHGYNDRFAMGSPAAAAIWGDRLTFTLATCTRMQVHAEANVDRLMKHYNLQARLLPFNFFRVRSNGVLAFNDYDSQFKLIPCDQAMIQPFLERARLMPAEAPV